MSQLKFRTLDAFGENGFQIEFPNGSVLSIRHDSNGVPELLIEGTASVLVKENDRDPLRQVCKAG